MSDSDDDGRVVELYIEFCRPAAPYDLCQGVYRAVTFWARSPWQRTRPLLSCLSRRAHALA